MHPVTDYRKFHRAALLGITSAGKGKLVGCCAIINAAVIADGAFDVALPAAELPSGGTVDTTWRRYEERSAKEEKFHGGGELHGVCGVEGRGRSVALGVVVILRLAVNFPSEVFTINFGLFNHFFFRVYFPVAPLKL